MTSRPLLAVDRVNKSFRQLHAVRDVSFEVHAGEVFGFLGPNGAGKTTTLRMILGITRPDRGEVRFDGGTALDRTRVGYLPEERGLYEDAGVLDTLAYLGTLRGLARADARARAREWLERLQLADRAKAKLNTLSKGNQQKVQFAGAVLHGPVLAVLDEPFAGLDPVNQELFKGAIHEQRERGGAVLLSSHQLDLVERLCDRFLLIARGHEVLSGTLGEMRRRLAGGASEVLAVTALPRAGAEGAVAELEALLERAAPGAERAVSAEPGGRLTVELPLRAGADVGPILAALSGRFALERVHMRPLPLHEIYLRAVRATGEADDAAAS